MRLIDASLCLDCDEVFAHTTVEGEHVASCPRCGSRAKAVMAKWLNREETIPAMPELEIEDWKLEVANWR